MRPNFRQRVRVARFGNFIGKSTRVQSIALFFHLLFFFFFLIGVRVHGAVQCCLSRPLCPGVSCSRSRKSVLSTVLRSAAGEQVHPAVVGRHRVGGDGACGEAMSACAQMSRTLHGGVVHVTLPRDLLEHADWAAAAMAGPSHRGRWWLQLHRACRRRRRVRAAAMLIAAGPGAGAWRCTNSFRWRKCGHHRCLR